MNFNYLVAILVAVIILELIFIIFFIIVNKMFRDELKQCKDVNKNLRKLVDTWRNHYSSLKSFYDLAGDAQIDKLQREIQVLRTMLAQQSGQIQNCSVALSASGYSCSPQILQIRVGGHSG